MDHWSKTSVTEPQPLGRQRRRQRDDDAGASRAGKVLKLMNIFPVPRNVSGAIPGGETAEHAEKPKRLERQEEDAGALHGGSGKSVKTTHVSPASQPDNGGLRSSGREEMTRLSSARRRESTNVRSGWPSGTGLKVDHRPRNVSAISPPREGMTTELTEWEKARESIMTVLQSYRDHCKILERDKSKLALVRVDLVSSDMIKEKFPHLLENKAIVGTVPGIEVGDRFTYRAELRLARMHAPLRCGIDTTVDSRGNHIAISIVDSGGYENYMTSSDTFVYCAQGCSAENQREKPVNLAMRRNMELRSPVRVIKTRKAFNNSIVYFYDGLYTVEAMWVDKTFDGRKLKFKLVRIPG